MISTQTWVLVVGLLLFAFGQSGPCHSGESKNSATAKTYVSSSSNATNSNSNIGASNNSKDMNKSGEQGNESHDGEKWGGEHLRLVMKAGGADLEFDCAHGEITVPVKPNAQGHFDLQGTFQREGGPVRSDGASNGRTARYVGQIDHDTMTFQIHLTSPDETTETFTLTRGNEGRLRKCR